MFFRRCQINSTMLPKSSGYEKTVAKEDDPSYKNHLSPNPQQNITSHINNTSSSFSSTYPRFQNTQTNGDEVKSFNDTAIDLRSSSEQFHQLPPPPSVYYPRMYQYPTMDINRHSPPRTLNIHPESHHQLTRPEESHLQDMAYTYLYGNHANTGFPGLITPGMRSESSYHSEEMMRRDAGRSSMSYYNRSNFTGESNVFGAPKRSSTSEAATRLDQLSTSEAPVPNISNNERLNSSGTSDRSSNHSSPGENASAIPQSVGWSSGSALMVHENRPTRRHQRPQIKIPEEQKDEAYREKRRKNNESAKRSRELKRLKEEQNVSRSRYLENLNYSLTAELAFLKEKAKGCPRCGNP